ncbi:MAG: hypothetical protein FD151_1166 [bacterium]|nr:MAG: hypothetical protein FD151_1166 [bacterium]
MRNNDILWKLIEDKVVLLDMDEGRAIILNDVGSHIWMALEKQKTQEELVHEVTTAFDIDEDVAKKDTRSFLDEMIRKDLIRVL